MCVVSDMVLNKGLCRILTFDSLEPVCVRPASMPGFIRSVG